MELSALIATGEPFAADKAATKRRTGKRGRR